MKKVAAIALFSLVTSVTHLGCIQNKPTANLQSNKPTHGKVIVKNVEFHVMEIDNSAENFEEFDTWIKKHRRRVPGANGVVFINFTNEADGSITNISIEKGLNKAADSEALRLVRLYPKWKPDLFNGAPSKSKLTMPIEFGKAIHNTTH